MAVEPATNLGNGRRRVTVDGQIYEPTQTCLASRQQRSWVSSYMGEDIKGMAEYTYQTLPYMRRRIRLLNLHGGGLSNPEITCDLFEAEFKKGDLNLLQRIDESNASPVEYEALSWCWGREERDRAIRIQSGNEYYKLAVTRELSLALKYLRYADKSRILWIDALCINQENHEERNHQVQLMARIYSGAVQACIWLGEDNDDSTTAIAFIQEIMKLEHFDTVSENIQHASKWQSLLLLMQRPWFSRRWVVQEVTLARAATIYCGSDSIPWENFAVAVELFVEVETATHRLSEVMRKDERFGHIPQWFEHVSELGASVLVEATGKVFRRDGIRRATALSKTRTGLPEPTKSSEWTLQRPLLSLEYLVSTLTVFEASQPRDAVYSLLAIARDTAPFAELQAGSHDGYEEAIIMTTVASFLERKPFRVDYSRPYSDICKDLISFCIHVSGKSNPSRALDILCRPWAPDPETVTPGVIHKQPVLYKDRGSDEGREVLWKRKPSKTYRRRVDRKPAQNQEDKENAELEVDTRTTQQYWEDVYREYEDDFNCFRETFLRDVYPYLPNNTTEDPHNGQEDSEEEDGDAIKDLDLPSWVAKISGASFALYRSPGMNEGTRIGRQNADSLVGPPQDGHKTYGTYSAAQNAKVDYSRLVFRRRPGKNGDFKSAHHSLYVDGFILGKVESRKEPSRRGGIPKTWIDDAKWRNALGGETEPPAEFWRTLVADRGKDNRNAPYYYATACKESIRKGGLRGGAVDTDALISKERNSIIAEFCRRVQAVVWNRRLIRTIINPPSNTEKQNAVYGNSAKVESSRSVLGLASEEVKKGDLVCILYGCTVPVILRKYSKKEEDLPGESMQDHLESMRAALSICEEACFRRVRYNKHLALRPRAVKEAWTEEVKAETEEVNKQLAEWKRRKEQAAQQEKEDQKEDEKRKRAAAERRAARKAAMDREKATSIISENGTSVSESRFSEDVTTATGADARLEGTKAAVGLAKTDQVKPRSTGQSEPIIANSRSIMARLAQRRTKQASEETLLKQSEHGLVANESSSSDGLETPGDVDSSSEDTTAAGHRQRAGGIVKEKDWETSSSKQSEHGMPANDDGVAAPAGADASPENAKAANQKKIKEELEKEDRLTYYKLIGDAYIHGMMDGEAVRLQINEHIPRRTFELR